MRLVFFILIFSILYGCMPNRCLSDAAAVDDNVVNLSRLKPGMNQVQVLKIMRHPYSDQVFVLDQEIYDVWFYITRRTVLGQSRLVPMNLTPLTFKNGILIGWGSYYYTILKNRQLEAENAKVDQSAPAKPKEPPQNLSPLQPKSPQPPSPQGPQNQPKNEQNQKKGQPAPSVKPAEPKTNWGPISPEKEQPAQPQGQGTLPQSKSTPQKNQGKEESRPPNGQNWSPLEEEQQPQQPPPQGKQSSQLSMSGKPKNQDQTPDQGRRQKKAEENRVPLTEEDEEMLRQEREQDFNQT